MRIIIEIDETAQPKVNVQNTPDNKGEETGILTGTIDAGMAPNEAKPPMEASEIATMDQPAVNSPDFNSNAAMSAGAAPGQETDAA